MFECAWLLLALRYECSVLYVMPPKKQPQPDPKQQSMLGFVGRSASSSTASASSSASSPMAPATSPPVDAAEGPPAKRRATKESEEPKKDLREVPEKHRQLFPWILHDQETGAVVCDLCKKGGVRSEWANGKELPRQGWKKDAFVRHSRSKEHQQAAKTRKAQTDFKKSLQLAVSRSAPGIIALMKNILFIVQQEKAIHGATALHDLVSHQIESSGGSSTAIPLTHRSNYSTYTMLDALNLQVQDIDSTELQNALCFGIHMDESTDISQEKCLLIYVQFVREPEFKPVQKFLTALPLQDTTAQGILDSTLALFKKIGVDLQKTVSFTSDGAAVMLGSRSGVAERLRQKLEIPHMVEFHCVAHKEALAVKDAYGQNKFFLRFERQISELISYLHTHKHIQQLKNVAESLELNFTQLTRIFEVRWLSRSQVISKLIHNLPVIQPTLADLSNSDCAAEGFYKIVSSEQFLLTLFFLADVLSPLAILSKQFQVKNFHPFDVSRSVGACIAQLEAGFLADRLKPGENMKKLLEWLDSKTLQTTERLTRTGDTAQVFRLVKQEVRELADDVIRCLKERLLRDNELLQNAKIFVPSSSESLDGDSFHVFGNEAVVSLAHHFQDYGISESDILQEWNQLKYELLHQGQERASTWLEVLKEPMVRAEVFPNLATLAQILLCFCAENAEVERGFSLYNRLKTKTRNKLKIGTIDMLMRLRLNTAPYPEFDFSRGATIWFGMCQRGRYRLKRPELEAAEDSVAETNEEILNSIEGLAGEYEEDANLGDVDIYFPAGD